MSNRIKMVVFDMAGTTIDEQNVVYKTLHKAINKHGVNVELDVVLKLGAGKEKFQAIQDIVTYLGVRQHVDLIAIFEDFKALLDQAYATLVVLPIKGVENVMLTLKSKGVIVVLNTGYDSKISNLLLDKVGWDIGKHYDYLVTASEVDRGRPSPDMIFKAMDEFSIDDASRVLKAGDSAIDIEEGQNAKCGVTVGVLSGAQSKTQIASMNPTYILNSLSELLHLDIF